MLPKGDYTLFKFLTANLEVHSVDESYFITDLSEAISEVFSMPTPSNGVDVDELRFQKKLRNRANRKRRI